MRFLLLALVAVSISACVVSTSEDTTPPVATTENTTAPDTPEPAPPSETPNPTTSSPDPAPETPPTTSVAMTAEELCTALTPALSGTTSGLEAYAAPAVLADLSQNGSMYERLDARDGTCYTEAGDAYVFLGFEDRGEQGLYATEVHGRAAGDYAYASTRETCEALAQLLDPSMDTGMAWREYVDVQATADIVRELRDLDDPMASIAAGDGLCMVSSENYGDAEVVLHLASGESGMMAVLSTSRLAGDAASY